MNLYKNLFVFFLTIIIIYSCGGRKHHESSREKTTVNKVTVGKVTQVYSSSDPACTFVYYVPDSIKVLPLIIFFDPHAKATEVIEKYRGLADKYSFAIAASGNIKNGMQPGEWEHYYKAMCNDLFKMIKTDTASIFLSGFSGGARVAAYLAFNGGNIRGLVTCGAGIPEIAGITNKDFRYVGMSGMGDFNFSELFASEKSIRNSGVNACFRYFDGKHEWPSDTVMEYAFIALNSGSDNNLQAFLKVQMNDTGLPAWKKFLQMNSLNDLLKSKQGFGEEKSAISAYLKTNGALKAYAEIEASLVSEMTVKNMLRDAFIQKDGEWWKKEIASLKVNAGINKCNLNELKIIRLKGYVSMNCFMLVSSALQNNDTQRAMSFLKIYEMADPSNADMSYFYAIYNSKTGQYKAAIDSLGKAVEKGFSDKVRWMNENALAPLRDSIRFIELEQKLN